MKTLISALVVSSALTLPAMAQTTPAPADAPAATTSPAAPADTAAPAETMASTPAEGGFLTYQEGNQLLGSGLMGANVQGADGEDIGSVSDIVLDRDGQVQAVIVGVGGFLGIGEKDVAIANDQLEFVLAPEAAAADATATNAAPAAPAATDQTTTSAAPAAPAADPAAGGTAGTAAIGTSADGTMAGTDDTMAGSEEGRLAWNGAGIDHIKVNFTRQQLEEAPAFEAAE